MSLAPSYFDRLYAQAADPWGFATRPYEARKYALTMAALPRDHYSRVYEPGCSIGVLTSKLAERADSVLATDVSTAALATARANVQKKNVTFQQGAAPRNWPGGTFDLIVFSELGYYLSEYDLQQFITQSIGSLDPKGHLIAVHWRQPVPDYPSNGDTVHEALASSSLTRLAHYREANFRLEVFGRSNQARLIDPDDATDSR